VIPHQVIARTARLAQPQSIIVSLKPPYVTAIHPRFGVLDASRVHADHVHGISIRAFVGTRPCRAATTLREMLFFKQHAPASLNPKKAIETALNFARGVDEPRVCNARQSSITVRFSSSMPSGSLRPKRKGNTAIRRRSSLESSVQGRTALRDEQFPNSGCRLVSLRSVTNMQHRA